MSPETSRKLAFICGVKSTLSEGLPKMRWYRESPGPVGRHLWLNKQKLDDPLGSQVWRTDRFMCPHMARTRAAAFSACGSHLHSGLCKKLQPPTSKLDPWGMRCESRVPLSRIGQSDVWVYMPFPMMVNEILISQAGVSTRKLGVELADEYHAYHYELAKGTNVITSV